MLTVIPHRSIAASAIFPVEPTAVTSTNIRWLSVPPLIKRSPPLINSSASTLALSMTCWAVSLELGLQCFTEANGFAGDHVHQWTTLHSWEYRAIDFLGLALFLSESIHHGDHAKSCGSSL